MIISSTIATNAAAKSVKVKVDAKTISYKVKPVIKSGSIFVDAKVTAKALKAKYSYNKKSKKITIKKGNIKIIYTLKKKTATVNGKKNKVKAPFLKKKKPFIEFKFFSKKLGYTGYSYNKKKGIVSVKTKKVRKPAIVIVGDSTASKNYILSNPKRGWGQQLGKYITDKFTITNLAQDGESSKSFYDSNSNYIKEVLVKGDYIFIQFGHNDQKKDMVHNTDPTDPSSVKGSYKYYLLQYINAARAKGATPVIFSPVARGQFDSSGKSSDTLGAYTKAAKELAEEQKVIYIPLNEKSIELYEEKGKTYVEQNYFIYDKDGGTEKDLSHFVEEGANEICKLIVTELTNSIKNMFKSL